MNPDEAWIWSAEYGRYYRRVYNSQTGNYDYVWHTTAGSSTDQSASASTTQASHLVATGSGYDPNAAPADYSSASTASISIDGTRNSGAEVTRAKTQPPAAPPPSSLTAGGPYSDLITQWSSAGNVSSAHAHEQRNYVVSDPNMAPAASFEYRNNIQFQGTPDRGWYEPLDSRYRMRTRGEANDFFRTGRVFAMLWAEAASETMARRGGNTENTAITVGRFGQSVFSQIRRFVVVQVNRRAHFVYALAISTYGGRGVTKPGCRASEHTVVHLNGKQPVLFQGERERGMTKEPIMIDASSDNEIMEPSSRLRCGKIYSIEWNVKVRDIGMVSGRHKTRLMSYFREEQNQGFDADSEGEEEEEDPVASYPQNLSPYAHGGYQSGTRS